MRRHVVALALLATPLALSVAACAPSGDDAAAFGSSSEKVDAKSGERVLVGRVALVAPPPGQGLVAEVLFEDGDAELVQLEADAEGRVYRLAAPEDDTAAEPEPTGVVAQASGESTATNGSPSPCADKANAVLGYSWKVPFAWSFNAKSTPAGLSVADVEAKLQQAAKNITTSRNSCALTDQVSAKHVYQGRTTALPAVAPDGSCTASDGQSTVGFGDLPRGVLGVTCTWYSGGDAVESDVLFNKVDHAFYATKPAVCTKRYSLEGVATHEFGHAFGLAHVTEAKHGNLTMSTAINAPCQSSEATLGRGDVIALRKLY